MWKVAEAYEYMDKKILTNATEVFVSYVALPKLPSDMTPLLSDMVVRQLAYLISIPMVKNDAISNRIYSEFQQLHAMAMTREGIAQHEGRQRDRMVRREPLTVLFDIGEEHRGRLLCFTEQFHKRGD